MRAFLSYVKILFLLLSDVYRLFGFKYVFLQVSFVVSSIVQLMSFFLCVRLLSSNQFEMMWFGVVCTSLFGSSLIGYLGQSRLLKLAIEYEGHWLCRFAAFPIVATQIVTDGIENLSPERQQARHLSTILRNVNIILSRLLVAIPIFCALVYIEPALSLALALLFVLTAFPLYLLNKRSSQSFEGMQMSSMQDREDVGHLGSRGYTSRKTLDMYEEMLRSPVKAKFYIDLVTVGALSISLLFVLEELVSLANVVVFLVGGRFLLANVGAIASSLTTVNRFYGTLSHIARSYFDNVEALEVNTRNFQLEDFFKDGSSDVSNLSNRNTSSVFQPESNPSSQFENSSLALVSMTSTSFGADSRYFFPGVNQGEVYSYSLYSGQICQVKEAGKTLSFPFFALSPEVRESLDYVALSKGLLFFDTDWHKSFLVMVRNMLKPGGRLVVPVIPGQAGMTCYGLPVTDFEKWLGLESEHVLPGIVTFVSDGQQDLPKSSIVWFAEFGQDYLRRGRVNNDPALYEVLSLPGFEDLSEVFSGTSGLAVNEEAVPDFEDLEYLTVGSGQKFAVIKAVSEKYFGSHGALRILDHGSAFGVVPAQAVFESDMEMDSITVVEGYSENYPLVLSYINYMTPKQRQKLIYVNSLAENYEYTDTYHIISFIHVFYLIEKQERENTLARAIDSLEAGGVVILWEVLKDGASASNPSLDQMISREELDELCKPYRKIACLNPRNLRSVDSEEFNERSVIFVLGKSDPKRRDRSGN